MKTEAQIKNKLEEYEKELKEVEKRFEEYDNHEDIDLLAVLNEDIIILEWVLSQ